MLRLAVLLQAAADSVVLDERTSFWTEGGSLWLPPQESTTAHEVDSLFYFILYTSLILTLIVTAAMVYFVWKYRRKNNADRPVDVIESKWLELSWVTIPTVLVLVVFFWGGRGRLSTATACRASARAGSRSDSRSGWR